MSSFLTLEDVNSVVGGFGASTLYHEIDTGSVGSETFDNVKIDFCIVSKSANAVSVTVENDAWIGAYYTLDSNGDYLGLTGNYNSSTKTLTFNTNTHIIIGFVCNMSVPIFNVAKTKYKYGIYRSLRQIFYRNTIAKMPYGATVLVSLILSPQSSPSTP